MAKKHLTLLVKGSVQGVFFRASTVDMALSLGISGVVKNEPDGSVYIEAEGEQKELDQFVAWCRQGPPAAHVEQCDVSEGPLKNYARFEIQR